MYQVAKRAITTIAAAVLLGGALVAPAIVKAADRSLDPVLVADQAYNYGRGGSDQTTLGQLSAQAYTIESYLQQYETTNRNEWLDKFVEQANRIIGNAEDPEGDGILGWYDARYSHKQIKNGDFTITGAPPSATELLTNRSFETDANADNIPDGWTVQGSSASVNRSTSLGDAYEGSAGVIVESDGTNANRLVQSFSVTAGKTYVVEAFAGTQTEKTAARIEIFNPATNAIVAQMTVHHVGFERYVFQFTAPSTSSLMIRLGLYDYTQPGYKARFDLLSVRQTLDPLVEQLTNGRFETPDSVDATLPKGWARWPAGTVASNVYLISGINNYYRGTRGLAIQTDGSTWKVAEQVLNYTPSQTYTATYWGRVSDTNYSGRVEIYNATDDIVIATSFYNNNEWRQRWFSFTAPSMAGKTLKIRLYQNQTPVFISYVDELSVVPVTESYAAGWTSNAPLSQARFKNSLDAHPSGGRGLELIHDGITAPRMSQQLLNYDPGFVYEFSVYAKMSPGATGRLTAYDSTAAAPLGTMTFTNDTRFEMHKVRFTAPAPGHDIQMRIEMDSSVSGHKLVAYSAGGGPLYANLYDEARIVYPMLKFTNLVYSNPALQTAFGSAADAYRDFAAHNIALKYENQWVQVTGVDGADNGTGLYVNPTGFSTEWFPSRSLPPNQYLAFGRMLYQLYDATDGVTAYSAVRPLYISRANDMTRLFKSKVRAHPLNGTLSTDAYVWSYWEAIGPWDDGHPYSYTNEDLSHSAETLKSVLEAYRHGHVFTLSDMRKFTRTLTDIMWNGSLTDPAVSYYNSDKPAVTLDRLNAINLSYWAEFAEFDRTAADIAAALTEYVAEESPYPSYLIRTTAALWSRNKVVNNGLEVIDTLDATLPANWTRFHATSANVYLDDTDAYLGQRSAAVKTNGSTWVALEQKLDQYEPNTPYKVTFYGKTDGAVSARGEAFDYTTNTVLGTLYFSNTSWTSHSFSFTTPVASDHNIRIRLYHTGYATPNAVAHFDEVRALPLLYESAVPNSGFEVGAYFNDTLPRFWYRGSGSDAANVLRDDTAQSTGLQSIRLTTATGGAAQSLYYDWYGYKPGGTYTVTASARTNGSAAGGRLKVVDIETNTELVSIPVTATSWTTHTATFTAPIAYDHRLRVYVTHNNPAVAGGELWVDDFGIVLN
ncbi:MAG: hypothetical protein K0Q94_475 [Paenibacillus sp.]|jgi:hypothetical protein|nr:hypothetical protein [Paenibacillus sp.]